MENGISYKELERIYLEYFNLGYINDTINSRFALISLICWIYKHLKETNPDTTYYKIVYKISEGLGLPDNFIKGLSIMCENFGYGCKEFPTFNIQQKDMIKTVKNILKNYVPF